MLKISLVVILTMLATGCARTDAAICLETEGLREALRASLLEDGGDMSVVDGAILLKTMQDYCGPFLPLGL